MPSKADDPEDCTATGIILINSFLPLPITDCPVLPVNSTLRDIYGPPTRVLHTISSQRSSTVAENQNRPLLLQATQDIIRHGLLKKGHITMPFQVCSVTKLSAAASSTVDLSLCTRKTAKTRWLAHVKVPPVSIHADNQFIHRQSSV